MWVCSFVGNTRLFLEFLGAGRNEGLHLVNHLATRGAAGGLKTRVQALRQVQAQTLSRLGLRLRGSWRARSLTGLVVTGAAALERYDLIVGRLLSRFGCGCEVLLCHG